MRIAFSVLELRNRLRWSRGHKVRGQGQGHKKISKLRPRTDLLEAKAMDQGHRRKCFPLPKKKIYLQNFFQAIST